MKYEHLLLQREREIAELIKTHPTNTSKALSELSLKWSKDDFTKGYLMGHLDNEIVNYNEELLELNQKHSGLIPNQEN